MTQTFAAWAAKMDRCGIDLAQGVDSERFDRINWDVMLGHAVAAERAGDLLGIDEAESERLTGCILVPGRVGEIDGELVAGPKLHEVGGMKIMCLPSFVVVGHFLGTGVVMSDVDDVSDMREMWWTALRPA